jgi:hypothetical protein
VTISNIESLYVPIELSLAAIALVWITVIAIIAMRRGDGSGKTLKVWARRFVEIIFGLH